MEYLFTNTAHGDPISIRLDEYSFTLKQGSREEAIAYASIVTVRITKSLDHVCKVYLYPDGLRPIVVTSQSLINNQEEKSREYALFVRILHHHLKGKSTAVFTSGCNLHRIWQWAGAAGAVSLIMALGAEYSGINLINAYALALVTTLMTSITLFVFKVNNLPKTYAPTNIPLQYLP